MPCLLSLCCYLTDCCYYLRNKTFYVLLESVMKDFTLDSGNIKGLLSTIMEDYIYNPFLSSFAGHDLCPYRFILFITCKYNPVQITTDTSTSIILKLDSKLEFGSANSQTHSFNFLTTAVLISCLRIVCRLTHHTSWDLS